MEEEQQDLLPHNQASDLNYFHPLNLQKRGLASSNQPLQTHNLNSYSHWTQTVPSSMPWLDNNHSFPGFSATNSHTAHHPHVFMPSSFGEQSSHHSRRRKFLDDNDGPQTKQFINEAKVAERFNSMHISDDNYDVPIINSNIQPQRGKVLTFEELEERIQNELMAEEEFNKVDEPTIVLSDEIKNLCDKQKHSLGDPTLDKILKPIMAVQIWKPPGGIISSLITPKDEQEKSQDKIQSKSNDELNYGNEMDML